MKKTTQSWVYFVLQIVFMLVLPCVMVWMQYGDLSQKYKVSVTAILLLMLIFFVFKKIMLNKWLKSFDMKIIAIESNSLSLTDETAIETNKKAWRMYSILQLFFNSIIPILLMFLAVITIKTVEEGLIKLYGCLMFCLISIFIGVVFRVAEIYSEKLPLEK